MQNVLKNLRDTVQKLVGAKPPAEPVVPAHDDLPALARQIIELVRENEEQRRRLDQQKFALDQHAIVSITDRNGRITYANDLFCELTGYSQAELLGQKHSVVNSGLHPTSSFAHLWRTIKHGQVWHGDICNRKKDGSLYWVRGTIVPLLDAHGEPEQYIAIRTDITEQKNIELMLEKSRQEAEQASRAKSAFLANVSHEIRTPLNALLGLAQVLERTTLDQDQADMVHRIRSAGQVLLRHLNDVLDFSKIESGQMALEAQPFKLSQLLGSLQGLMSSTARSQGLELSLQGPDDRSWQLIGDAGRLSQILLNLVSNAIKFTMQGKVTVEVRLLERSDTACRLRIEVSDTGIGIAPDKLAMLFAPFTQVDSSVTRRYGGTGLGLSICKSLVELMEGVIGVTSEQGVGSTFWLELPFQLSDKQPEPLQWTPPVTRLASQRLSGCHILVVDDSEMNRAMVERMLHLEGASTTLAENGQQAIAMLKLRPDAFDAVLMDIQMPLMDGLEATQAIRQQPGLCELPVLVCSAGVQAEERAKALATGANDFIVKPIELESMVAQLLRMIRKPAPNQPGPAGPGASTDQPLAERAPAWPNIAGIDCARMQDQLNGDREFFLMLLRMLVQELQLALQQLPQQWAPGQGAALRLHKLGGAAGTVGATGLVRVCRRLEDAVARNDPARANCWAQFEAEAQTLLRTVPPWLGQP